MKLNKNSILCRIVVMMIAFMTMHPLLAQDEMTKVMNAYSEVQQEKSKLEEEVKVLKNKLKTDTTRLIRQNKEEKKRLEELYKKEIKALRSDSINKDKIIKGLKEDLKKQANDKSQEVVKKLNNQLTEATQELDNLKSQLEQLQQAKQESDNSLAEAQQELEKLKPFRKLRLEQIMENYQTWSDLPFSQLNTLDIQSSLDDCSNYGKEDPDFQDASQKLQLILDDCQKYHQAESFLEKPYDASAKKEIRSMLADLLKKFDGRPQYEEIDNTDALVRDYDGYVLFFQDLITKINKELEDSRTNNNRNSAKNMLDACLKDEQQQEAITEINKIPYLKGRLEVYLGALRNNPLQKWDGEEEIMKMVE